LVATDYIETGASTAQAGILEDMPRLDYSGGASCPSLLLEPQRSNLITQSEYFGDSSWTKLGSGTASTAIVTSNYATSPDGLQNASRLQCDLNGGTSIADQSLIYDTITGSGDTSAFVYVKSNTGSNQTFYLANTLNDRVSVVATTEWQKFELNWNASANGRSLSIGTRGTTGSDDTLDLLIWGAQVEVGSYPTSYIPTYGSSVTRSFDNAGTRTDMQDFLGTDTGAWFMHLDEFYFDITGTGLGSIILAENGQQAISIELIQDGQFQYKITLNNSTAISNLDGEDKLIMNWSSEFFKIFINGVESYSSTSSQWSNAFTHLILPQTTRAPHIKIKQMLFFPTALTDSECIALTTL